MLSSISLPGAEFLLAATVEINTINTTATISWIMSTTVVRLANGWSLSFMSSKALTMMAVEDIDSIPPRKRLSIVPHPITKPSSAPTPIMPRMPRKAVMKALLPIDISFLKLNSRPTANIMKMIPISDQTSTSPTSVTVGKMCRWGPTRKPATR